MAEFIPGQRCISDAELQMGLGTILTVEHRTLTVLFMATGETRTYAKLTAPLTRVLFAAGDTVNSHDGAKVTVTDVVENHGLVTYIGTDNSGAKVQLEEAELDNFIQLNRPSERLFNGKIDKDRDMGFSMRERHADCRNDENGYPARVLVTDEYIYIKRYECFYLCC